jgi:NitT/TauT family transport system substrate-binding protein
MAKFSFRTAPLTRREFVRVLLQGAAVTAAGGIATMATGAMQNLKLGNIPVVNFAAVYRLRAISKDFGFEVEFVNFPSGTERLNALAAGYIDGAGTGVTQPILLRSKGVPLKIVSDLSRKGKGLMVGSGIQQFGDLRGKDIGSVPGSGPDIFLRQKLSDEGLNPDRDVNLVNIDFLQMPTAVLSGRVAAASSNEPQIASFEAKGGRVLSYLSDTKLGDIDGVMNFPDSFIKKDRGLAKAVVAALARASRELQNDPNLVVDTMADVVKVEKDVIRRSLKNLEFTIKPDAKALASLASAKKEMKLIERLPAVDEYLDMSLVEGL